MKLALSVGYSGARLGLPVSLVQEAERLGFDSVWTAEAYGSDAVTPLAYLAAHTSRIKLGTGILQIPARTPAMTAMTMSTLDQLSGGRAVVGLGLSGPQVVEGWHGVSYGTPAVRMREYVQILRHIWARESPLSFSGREYRIPYDGPDASGTGTPLKSILHGRQVPIYLAAMGPVNLRTAGELADGWLANRFSPYRMALFRPALEAGFRRAGSGKGWADFDVNAQCRVIVTDDVAAGLRDLKPHLALYVGGMGAREKNFHNQLVTRFGYGEAAAQIQDLYLAGRKAEAEAAVPDDLVDEINLVGPPARIRDRLRAWQDAGVTTMLLSSVTPEAMRLMAELVRT